MFRMKLVYYFNMTLFIVLLNMAIVFTVMCLLVVMASAVVYPTKLGPAASAIVGVVGYVIDGKRKIDAA